MKYLVHKIGFLSWVGEDALMVLRHLTFHNPKPLQFDPNPI